MASEPRVSPVQRRARIATLRPESGRRFRRWLARTDVDLGRVAFVSLTVAGAAVLSVIVLTAWTGLDFDAYRSIDLNNIYVPTGDMSAHYAFRYGPPIAILMAPLGAIPFAAPLWFAGQLASLWYVGRRWALALVLFPPVGLDLVYGNVNLFIAAAIVVGFRHPAAWAFPVLTKVTPAVGLAWFAVRREWKELATALGVIAGALVFAEVILPGATRGWLDALRSNAGIAQSGALAIPLWIRLIVAVVVVAWGALSNRRWTVPVAVTLAMPVWWPISFVPLIAILPILREEEGRSADGLRTFRQPAVVQTADRPASLPERSQLAVD